MNENINNYLMRFREILFEMENKMLSQNITDSITVNFIRCMIPHHQAAIYMCENLLEYTSYQPLIKIARDIIQMQTRGIEQMKHILQTTVGYTNSNQDINNYMNEYFRITKNMISKMRNSPRCSSINLNFVVEMIPHHRGAIEMCNNLLKYQINPRLKQVALNIIQEQSEGIGELENVRRDLCHNQ